MISYHFPLIAREGWRIISILVLLAALVQYYFLSYWNVLIWLLVLGVCYFFRDPPRRVPALPLGVVAPVDGRVVAIEKCTDPYLDRQAICITVRKPWYNLIAIRNPMEGKIMNQWHERMSTENDIAYNKFIQWVQSDESDDVTVSITLLGRASFLRCYRQVGERIGQGQRCGTFPLSAVIDIALPERSSVNIKVGDKIKSGSDTIATLIH